MGCSSCGDSGCGGGSSCGSCADACNPCGGPTKVITKQGLQGANGDPGRGYDATSDESIDVLDTAATGTGGIISTEKAYTPGARVRWSDTAAPAANYFEGIVASYDPITGGMGVSNIDLKVGSGTHTSWDVNLAGELPSTLDDRFGYTTSSTDNLNLDLFGTAGSNPSITVETRKSFVAGDIVRVQDDGGFYIETSVASYDSVSGVLTLERVPQIAPFYKTYGNGTLSDWTITLINKEQVRPNDEYSLIYEARRIFTDPGTVYIDIGDDDPLGGGTLLSFDPADPDVTVSTKIPNSVIREFPDDDVTNYAFIEGNPNDITVGSIKAIEVELFLPMTALGEDLAGDRWMTAGANVDSGSIGLVKNSYLGFDYSNTPELFEAHKVSINKNTKTVSIIWRIPYFQLQKGGADGSTPPNMMKFWIQNNTDLEIRGGNYLYGTANMTRQYALRIYI